jgi:hypothetical protein
MQAEWFDEVYARSPKLWAAVEILLAVLQKSGVPLGKERLGSLDLKDSETIGVYVMDCEAEGLAAEDVTRYGHEARRGFRFFPSSGEFARAIAAVKATRHSTVITDAVHFVREISKGEAVIAMASKAKLEAEGVPWFNSDKEARQSVAHALHGRRTLSQDAKG